MPIYDLDDGVSQIPVVHVTVLDTRTGETTRIPLSVVQWLETIPKSVALLIVENYYASEE